MARSESMRNEANVEGGKQKKGADTSHAHFDSIFPSFLMLLSQTDADSDMEFSKKFFLRTDEREKYVAITC